MICNRNEEVIAGLKGIQVTNEVDVKDRQAVGKDVDLLVKQVILSDSQEVKNFCFWIIWELAQKSKIYPASIHDFYMARGRGEVSGFTVPAINIRTFPYESARSIFKVAKKCDSGAFIFEIAESEIGYTDQSPAEYTAVILAAAIKEGFEGPVFIQADQFKIDSDEYAKSPGKEIHNLKDLVRDAVESGFYNIDIDSSTLVDLSKKSVEVQQRLNCEVFGEFVSFIKELQPAGVDISIGGKIGEVGRKNSDPQDLRAFMNICLDSLGSSKCKTISKLSVQTGTFHGGVVLPDGSLAQVKIDFDTLKSLSEISRKEFGLAGVVQHGASTLPAEAFHKFPEIETAEIHLATQFQNIVYDNLPLSLKEGMYDWLRANMNNEKDTQDTSAQFIYKVRKKALGPFKKELFTLKKDIKDKIKVKLEEEFRFLFKQLKVENTRELVKKYVTSVSIEKQCENAK